MAGVRPSAIRELLRLGADPSVISFGGGYPDASLFPVEELATVYAHLLVPEHAEALQYTTSNGLPVLRPRSPTGSPATARPAPPTTC
jgi:2-aminoadipate transaminase